MCEVRIDAGSPPPQKFIETSEFRVSGYSDPTASRPFSSADIPG